MRTVRKSFFFLKIIFEWWKVSKKFQDPIFSENEMYIKNLNVHC